MKKKVQAGVDAVRAGIPTVVFGDARVERPISAAFEGGGTVVTSVKQMAEVGT
jgi:acetylglutamate/LysW-gamma-L-alpha-aminoadipate kinase